MPITSEKVSSILGVIYKNANVYGVDFLNDARFIGASSDIAVAPYGQKLLELVMQKNKIEYSVQIEDLEQYLAEEKATRLASKATRRPSSSDDLDLSRYYEYEEIIDFLKQIAEKYPNTVSLSSAGTSHEGRDIPVIVIDNGDNVRNKTTCVFDAGIHAREWIAPAT